VVRCFCLQMQKARHNLQAILDPVIDLLQQQILFSPALLKSTFCRAAVRLRRVLVTASLWPRRLEKPVLVLLDHRTKRVTPLGLARSVDFLLFVDDSRHHVVLIEHSDHAL
jgi:hypothetical protein